MTASNKAPQDDSSGMILVTGADEQTTQLMMSQKVKRIATPDLLYLGMAMSKRLWGWSELSETDFIDTVIYTLFNAAGVTLGAAYIKESNTLIGFREQPEETPEDHKIVTKKNVIQAPWAEKKRNVVQAPEKSPSGTQEAGFDISIDTPIGAQHGELIPWPEDEAKTEEKVSSTPTLTAADVIKSLSKKGE